MRTWLVIAFLLTVLVSPMYTQSQVLEDIEQNVSYSPLQTTVSPSTGWTSGGEEITITGSGFLDLRDTNVTYDGINHQWSKSTANYADQSGQENSIAVDSNGHIHIVSAAGDNYDFIHSVYDGVSWSANSIKGCEGTYCWDTHMVIDDNDHLHVAYSSNYNYIIYMNFNGTAWTWSQVSSSGKVGPVGIAVDSNNLPHVSYAASGSYCGGGLKLASFDGVNWNHQNVDYGSNRGCSSAMIIDDNDNINIAYQNRDDSKLKFATDKSGSWIKYSPDFGNPASSLYPGYYSSMAMDSQGQFHIAHYDSKEEDLRYSTGVPNGQWTTTIVDSGGNTGRNPAIAVDAAGDPHIVYETWSGFDLKYATLNPSSSNWQISNVETAGSIGDSSSIFIDDSGIIHIAYSDDTNNVLRYAAKNSGVTVTNEISVQFGQYGYMTGEVVDDSTIVVNTPFVSQADTITLSLWDKDGNEHQLSSTFEFISQDDLDSDGVLNDDDDCPNVAGTSTQDLTGCPDDDGDGYSNSGDAFPSDTSEWADSDGDSVGDNADAFPNDATETTDSDGDGVGDNSDAFPSNSFEQYDSDGDGVGDNSDAFPNDASESADSDNDGVGDNADAFPMNAFESLDSDGDGVGDNSDAFPNDSSESADSDGDGVGDNSDAFPNDASETVDSDGDGTGDNSDAFPNDATRSADTDGDGVDDAIDQCPNSLETDVVDEVGCNIEIDSDGDGIFDIDDQCPDVNASALDENDDGCLDDEDGDGVIDSDDRCDNTQSGANVSDDGCSDAQLMMLDTDLDGVSDFDDNCSDTPSGSIVDEFGCVVEESEEDEEEAEAESADESSAFESFFSGESGPVTTTFGISAILLALFTLLQTNAAAAILPDAFRWIQVMRKNSKLTKEERNELTYLQSIVQAYYNNPQELAEELNQLKADLTGRYTNNELKKQTREKLFTLIDDLLASSPGELHRIAHNDAYFGLIGTVDSHDRSKLLDEKLAMAEQTTFASTNSAPTNNVAENNNMGPSINATGQVQDDGFEWYEWPQGSGVWWYRTAYTQDLWQKWQQ